MQTKLLEVDVKDSYRHLLEYFAQFDFDFFIFTITATVICFFGFAIDSPSIIIGSMVLSPLLYPIIAMATALYLGDWKVFRNSFFLLMAGFLVIIFISLFLTFFIGMNLEGSEIVERIYINNYYYFIVALFSGFAAMFCFLWPKALEAMTGVAISIAILPPLVILGISSIVEFDIFIKAIRIVIVNTLGLVGGALAAISLINTLKKILLNKKINYSKKEIEK